MTGGGNADQMLGFKEDDAMRFIFGEDITGMEDDSTFDRSLMELQVFKEVFCEAHLPGEMDLGFMDNTRQLKVAETSMFSSARFDAPQQPAGIPAAPQPQVDLSMDQEHTHCHSQPNGPHQMDPKVDLQVEEHAHSHAAQNGASAQLDAAMQGFIGYWQACAKCATDLVGLCDHQQQFFSPDLVDNILDVHTQEAPQDVRAGMCNTVVLGGSSSTSAVDDPMPSYIEALAGISEFQSGTLSDPFLHQWLSDQQQFPSNTCLTYDQGQMVDATHLLCTSTADISHRGVEQYPLYSKAAHDTATVPQQAQYWFSPGQFAELEAICQNGTPGANISSMDDVEVHGCSNQHSGSAAVVSKKTLGRDLPDQLEAHAHRLFKDAGWTIKPRKRNDRAKMASYFTAPNREAVHTSLTQAWKFCGKKLYEASADSERGRYPKEWSDVDAFWKDLTDTMAYIDKMLVNQQNALTLLQRWEILDPFIAVVFISRKITALQQRKTLRAVDSSTFVLDDITDLSSESKSMHKAGDLLASRMIQSTPVITDSDCSTLATESYHGQQALQSCHDAEDINNRDMNSKLCCTKSLNCDASDQTENQVYEGDDTRQIYAQAKVVDSSVKMVRKKSKRIFDIDANGLEGLCSQSFVQPSTGNVFDHEAYVATADMSDAANINNSEEHGMCSGVGTLKSYLKAEWKSEKLDGNDQSNNCDMFVHSECKQLSTLQSERRIEELRECTVFSETHCTGRESDATVSCPTDKVQEKLLSSHGQFSKGIQNGPTYNIVPVESSHECNAAVLETDQTCESQTCKTVTAKRKLKGWEKYVKKRPRELRINDDDLLITAIVKNKDLVSCHKFVAGFSDAKKFKKLKCQKRGNKLLLRTTGKAGTNLLGGKRISLARKTVICWLIATGFLTVKDVIQYRDPKSNKVVKDGRLTWEGIICNCCTKTLSVSDFKAHAGCSLPKSSLGLFLQSGKSYTLCQVEAWSAEFMSRRSNSCGRKVEAIDENDDTCGFCGDGGELLCCDNCPSTYHQACLSAKELPEGSWYCHNCTCQICGGSISEKEVSTFSAIFKCLQCGDAYHDTCVEQEKLTFEGKRSDTWFCGGDCKEIFIGLHNHVGIDNILDNGLSWSILRCNSDGQKLHSLRRIARLTECNTKLAVALTLLEECFIRMVDPRTGVDMIPHVLYNKGGTLNLYR
ncbi:increased DNA methylation 1-like isoform X2 [Phragmites australis]|uniref:increased DNA methylation 1-like isoform X2 n=1 Tax=Phragmites australis TaxID=29695 RepID=UPI002D774E74|nr:increased DNA methylation 1-like isoform X2 [Phragmites australis]